MDIQDISISGYSFSGLIDAESLSSVVIEALDAMPGELLDVEGDFTIRWEGEYPLVRIDKLYACRGSKFILIKDEDIYFEFEQLIEEKGDTCKWMEDREDSEDDEALDEYYDA